MHEWEVGRDDNLPNVFHDNSEGEARKVSNIKMKWFEKPPKPVPAHNSTRIKACFLWLPCKIDKETRWLCFAKIGQRFNNPEHGKYIVGFEGEWVNQYFADTGTQVASYQAPPFDNEFWPQPWRDEPEVEHASFEHIDICPDGDQWSVLQGSNIQEGKAEFGATVKEAMANWLAKYGEPENPNLK